MSTTARADIILKIAADIAELRNAVQESKNATSSFQEMAKSGAAIALGFNGVESIISGIKDALKESIVAGVQYNATMESMRIAFAGMLRNFGGSQFKDFNSALTASDALMAKIRGRANELGISFEGLADTYKTSSGVLFNSGITNAQKQLDLVVTLQKAMQSLGVTGFQATRDIQDILTGQSSRTKAGRELGISDADIQSAREAGTLYEFLTQKLSGFNEAASASSDTLQAVEARLKNIKDAEFGEATNGLTNSYKELLKAITALIQSDAFRSFAKLLSDAATQAVKLATGIVNSVAVNNPNATQLQNAADNQNAANSVASQQDIDVALKRAYTQRSAAQASLKDFTGNSPQTLLESGYGKDQINDYVTIIDKANEVIKQLETKGAATAAGNVAKAAAETQAGQDAMTRMRQEDAEKYLKTNASEYAKVLNASQLIGDSDEDRLKTLDKQISAIRDQAADAVLNATTSEEGNAANVKAALQLEPLMKDREATEKRITTEKDKQLAAAYKEQDVADKAQETATARGEIEIARAALAQSEAAKRAVEQNEYLTTQEKRDALAVVVKNQNDLLDANIAKLKARADVTKDDSARNSLNTEASSLTTKKGTNTTDLSTKLAPQSIGDQMAAQFARMKDGFTTVAQAITGTIGASITGISGSIQGLINRTMTWRQAFVNIGTTIGQSVVKSFSDMTAQWIVQRGIMDNVNAAFHIRDVSGEAAATTAKVSIHTAGEVAKTGATAAGSGSRGFIALGETIFHGIQVGIRVAAHVFGELAKTTATAINTALRIPQILAESFANVVNAGVGAMSAMASIPYVGPILAIAALGAVLAAGFAVVGKVGKGFSMGGYTGDGAINEVAGNVHRGEVVFSQSDVARSGGVGVVEALRLKGASSVNSLRMSGSALNSNRAVSSPAQGTGSVVNAFFNTKQDASDWLRTQKGRTQMIDFLQQQRGRV